MSSHSDAIKPDLTSVALSILEDGAYGHTDDGHLAAEYEKFFQAVACSPSSVIITNADGVIEYVNDRFVEGTGYTREQAIGQKPSLLKSGQTDISVYHDLWKTILSGNTWRGELCNRRSNGEVYWEATAISPIVDKAGTITHFVAAKEDVTERRIAEDELKINQERDAVLAQVMRSLMGDGMDKSIIAVLKILGERMGAHRAFLFRLSSNNVRITNTHEWLADGRTSDRHGFDGMACDDFTWFLDRYHEGEVVAIADVEALPSAADKLKDVLTQGGIRANLTAPILQGGQFLGFVGIDFDDGPHPWSTADIDLCEHVSSALGLALLRLDAEKNMCVAYDAAQHAEQNLLDAIECMPEGFVLYDAEGNLEVCNDRFREDYRYSIEDAHPGVHFTDLGRIDISRGRVAVPSGYKDVDDYLETRRIYRTKLEGTFPVTLADGRYLMTRDRKTSSGGLVSIQTDITRIKKTEESLRLSERKFWSVFHASPSPMTIAGLEDGRFLDVNVKWSEIMGFEYTDVIGATAMELNVWPSPQSHARLIAAFSDDGVLTDYEGQLKTRSGELRDFLMSGSLISIDGKDHLLLVAHDITQRKDMERALKRSEREIRTILDNIVETFYRTDSDGLIVMISASVEALLGYSVDELIGTSIRDLYVDPSERGSVLNGLSDNGGRVRDYEVQLKRKDGSSIWVSSNVQHLYDRDENVIGLEGTTRDVTAQKEAAKALLVAKEEAESANAAKSDFLSGMSHELRTPLNAVIGFSQMMELHEGSELMPKQREYMKIIQSSGEHLVTLIDEVLDLARVEAGRMDVRAVHVEPTALLEECIALVVPMANDRNVEIIRNVPDQLPHMMVDRTRFKQIIINLLSNAVKYNVENGTVAVDVTSETDAMLTIKVVDTGQGMTPENCSALFEPFQRLGAEKSDVEGTGLGLVLAKRMVEAMGGSINVESAPGVGSTFSLMVPVAAT